MLNDKDKFVIHDDVDATEFFNRVGGGTQDSQPFDLVDGNQDVSIYELDEGDVEQWRQLESIINSSSPQQDNEQSKDVIEQPYNGPKWHKGYNL